jgi:hypothetical protein
MGLIEFLVGFIELEYKVFIDVFLVLTGRSWMIERMNDENLLGPENVKIFLS